MNAPIPDNTPDIPTENFPATAQHKAQQALQTGRDYARENPLVLAGCALVLGLVVGILCGYREPKRKDPAQAVRDVVDDVLAQISDGLSHLKKSANDSSFLQHCQDASRKLKWW